MEKIQEDVERKIKTNWSLDSAACILYITQAPNSSQLGA